MEKQVTLTFLFTFLVGLACGVYVYFAGYSPVATTVVEKVETLSDSLVIVGEAYGGCAMVQNSCPSFQVSDDGEYRYFYKPRQATEQVLREGSIPRALMADLRQVATMNELQVASLPIEPAFCDSYRDGIDVKYRVTVNDTTYELDSCGTDVDGNGVLWQTLSQLWQYFETVS